MTTTRHLFISQVNPERIDIVGKIPLQTPLVIYVEPSGYCNLKCNFCMHGTPEITLKKGMMKLELFQKLIDELEGFPEKIKLLRICGNGEPLLNPQIIPMLKYASASNKIERIELISNGLLLTNKFAEQLPKVLNRIIISVEGLNSSDYLVFTRTEVDFTKFIAQLKKLFHNRKDCTIHIKIHNEAVKTQKRRDTFFELFQGIADQLFIENLVPLWPGLEINCQKEHYRYEGKLIPKKICAQIFKGFQIQADGETVPCCVDWQRINLIGNLQNDPLPAIWHSRKLRQLQLAHLEGLKPELFPCQNCEMNDYCEIDNLDMAANSLLNRLQKP